MAHRSLFEGSVSARVRHAAGALGALFALACQPQIGDECETSVDCSQGGERLCDITQPGGYCTVFGCEPGGCPEESRCIAFGTELSSAAECAGSNGLSRFTRSFCLATCGSNGDCRGGYVCADVTEEPWSAIVVDRRGSGRVCIAPSTSAPVPEDRPGEVCSPSSGAGGSSD